ncbi:PQQ-binding-like beta-propeller repeat protein, partial [Verrucomicrobiota bacterium]
KAKTAEEAAKAIDEISAKLTEAKEKWAPTPLEQKYRNPRAHGGTGFSTPTPVSDGKHVWAVFGNGLVACYTVDGKRKWIRLVAKPTHGHGHAASPILVGGKLIVAIDSVYALDPSTGDEIWQAKSKARFGTPVAVKIGGADALITAEGQIINAADGKIARTGMRGLSFNSPVTGDGMVYFVNENEARAYKLPESLDSEGKPEEAWKVKTSGGRRYASPVFHNGLIYDISDRSSLVVIDAKTGEKAAEKKLGMKGACYTSLAVAGDYLIAGAEGGEVAVLKTGREPEIISKNKLDKLRSTPAVVGDRLYLRTMSSLYCIGPK